MIAGLHGLRIRSPWPPGDRRAAGSRPSDVDIAEMAAPLDGGGRDAAATPLDWFRYRRRPDGAEYLRWEGFAECLVAADGRRIEYRRLARCTPEALQTYLLGQVLSFALIKRGIEPLHASAVLVDGGALAFLGEPGRGKSTLAAAFLHEGFRLVTDDLLAVGAAGDRVVVYPGPGRLNLRPGPARRLLGRVAGARMGGQSSKQVFVLEPGRVVAGTRAVPLRAIYVLTRPPRPGADRRIRIRGLSAADALARLAANTFNPVVDERARLTRLLEHAAWLASRVPVRALTFPRALGSLPAVLRTIRTDAARLMRSHARWEGSSPRDGDPAGRERRRLRRPPAAR